jgi:MFS family permease
LTEEYSKKIDRTVYLLGSARFIRAFGRTASFIFLPVILFLYYHLSLIQIGIFSGFATLIMAIIQYYSGKLTDKIGRRKLLILIPPPVAILYFLMFEAILQSANYIVIISIWYLTVIFNALQFPAIQASVADVTSKQQRLKGFTIVRLFVNSGAAAGPLLGAFVGTINLSYIFLLTAVATLIELAVLFLALKETYLPPLKIEKRTFTTAFKKSSFLLWFSIIGIVFSFLLRQRGTTLTLFVFAFRGMTLIDIGLIYSLNGLIVVILQYPIFHLMSTKSNFIYWRGVGTAIYSASYALVGLIFGLYGYLFLMGIMTVGEDFVSPTTETIITSIAPLDSRGTYIGTYNMLTSIGSFLGSIIGLYFLEYFVTVPEIFWLAMAIGLSIISIAYVLQFPSYRREMQAGTLTSDKDIRGG